MSHKVKCCDCGDDVEPCSCDVFAVSHHENDVRCNDCTHDPEDRRFVAAHDGEEDKEV